MSSRVDSDCAAALDARILDVIEAWSANAAGLDDAAFDALARDVCAGQLRYNRAYRAFAAAGGIDEAHLPPSWRDIPAVPASAFKDATLATFDVRRAALEFHTSGTTAERAGKHYFETSALYDAALLAGFERFMLTDRARLRYLNLVPNPAARPHSSLGYMMGRVGALRGDGAGQFFLEDSAVDVDGFTRALDAAIAERAPVCLAGTAFGFVALIDGLATQGRRFSAPPGSRVMETGGFKGRSRSVERRELYARIGDAFGIPHASIVAEYGMTELTSQYYDAAATRSADVRIKVGPPWLRTAIVDANGSPVPKGHAGFLRHVDLANRASVVAIQTEDRGYAHGEGFVLLGRDPEAGLRGCSLDAEELRAPDFGR